jgi:hypothetical protein
MYRFSSDGTTAFCENPGSASEQWSVPDKTELASMLAEGTNQSVHVEPPSFEEYETDEGEDNEPYATLSSAIAVAQTAVRQCQIMKARLDRPRDKTIEILEGKLIAQEFRLKEALRQNDWKHEVAEAAAKVEHDTVLERLREVNTRLMERLSRGVDGARLRNEADTRERALNRRIRDLEHEVRLFVPFHLCRILYRGVDRAEDGRRD